MSQGAFEPLRLTQCEQSQLGDEQYVWQGEGNLWGNMQAGFG